jgi:hypothetical protein
MIQNPGIPWSVLHWWGTVLDQKAYSDPSIVTQLQPYYVRTKEKRTKQTTEGKNGAQQGWIPPIIPKHISTWASRNCRQLSMTEPYIGAHCRRCNTEQVWSNDKHGSTIRVCLPKNLERKDIVWLRLQLPMASTAPIPGEAFLKAMESKPGFFWWYSVQILVQCSFSHTIHMGILWDSRVHSEDLAGPRIDRTALRMLRGCILKRRKTFKTTWKHTSIPPHLCT